MHVFELVQAVRKTLFASVRLGYADVLSCSIEFFASKCFSSINWCFFLYAFSLFILSSRGHIIRGDVKNIKAFMSVHIGCCIK